VHQNAHIYLNTSHDTSEPGSDSVPSVDIARQCMERTKTTTSLRGTVRILEKAYQTRRKYAADFQHNMKIVFDDHLPKWNYHAMPEGT
jgi:hypothetical protein